MTMDVVICPGPGTLEMAKRERPVRGAGDVLVRIRRVGICGTDHHIVRGTQPYLSYPRVPGHELAGEIVEGDAEGRFAPGQTVCILPYLSCGTCIACRNAKENCCVNMQVLGVHRDGGLAEYLAVDARFVLDARTLSLDEAAMVEFLAIGHHAVRRSGLTAGQRVLVAGAGPIGMAVTLFARLAGAVVTVLDINAQRLALCVAELGAAKTVVADGEAAASLARISEHEGFEIVFDATGSPAAMEAGFAHVAHGGAYVLVSVVSSTLSFSDPEFHKREMTLLGSRNATTADFEAVIDAMLAGAIPTAAMHTHGAPLAELPEAMAGWMAPGSGVIKAIVTL